MLNDKMIQLCTLNRINKSRNLNFLTRIFLKKFEKISSALERTLQISRIELERDLRHSKWLADNLQ